MNKTMNKFAPEVRERAVRMVKACTSPETNLRWVHRELRSLGAHGWERPVEASDTPASTHGRLP
jgi:hypothetical protein